MFDALRTSLFIRVHKALGPAEPEPSESGNEVPIVRVANEERSASDWLSVQATQAGMTA